MNKRILTAAAILLAFSVPALAAGKYPLTELFTTDKTIVDEPLAYPAGQAEVQAAIVTLAPGEETPMHKHGVPLFAYILEGEVTVDYGSHGKKVYKQGDSFMEAMAVDHVGRSTGTVPVKILAVYMGAKGAENVIKSK